MTQRNENASLREGFTTGTAAAAAAMACVLLLHGQSCDLLDVPSPDGSQRIHAPLHASGVVARCDGLQEAWAEVIKDGGDDPDATHGAIIRCRMVLHPSVASEADQACRIRIDGGQGVGRVTLPGLPVPPGQAAINPGPRKQIARAVQEALILCQSSCGEADIVIEVPAGYAIARKTMNARLGILGGISILGTGGVVRPYSHDAWRATVEAGCAVARAMGCDCIGLCTGRRSERLLRRELTSLPQQACVQMADLFSHALRQARAHGFSRICIACYGGKLVKMAQGLEHTHASSGALDFTELAHRLSACGAPEHAVVQARTAVTARHVFELARDAGVEADLGKSLALDALAHARSHAGPHATLEIFAFSHDDRLMAREHTHPIQGAGS